MPQIQYNYSITTLTMLANFKWKQNTNGFAHNSQNINRNGRPIDIIPFITKEAIRNGDFDSWIKETLEYLKKKKGKISIRELLNIQRLAFARYWYLTGGDMKKYYRVMWIR